MTNTQVCHDHLLPRVFLELSLESFTPDKFYLLFISRLILSFHMSLPLRHLLSHSVIVVNCSGVLAFPLLHSFYYSFFLLLPPFCFFVCVFFLYGLASEIAKGHGKMVK